MKALLNISLFLALFTMALPCARAAPTDILDLTSLTSEGLINGALFQTADLRSSGTGTFQTFLKFGDNYDTVHAYNTDARPFEAGFNMHESVQHTRQLPLIAVPYMTPVSSLVTTGDYYEFLLDINQKGAEGHDSDPDWNLSLDKLQIALADNPDESVYSTIFANPIYDMDGLDDWRVILNGKLDTGSGQADLAVYIPKSLFDRHTGEYVYLYSMFGEGGDIRNNDGFEEWAIESEFELPQIPIALSAPNGGETLVAGDTYAIIWTSTGSISEVLIEYSSNNGSTWTLVNPANVGNTGSYDWLVPEVDSDQCLVRISDASGPGVNDVSDDVFTIEGQANLPDLEVISEDISFDPLPGAPGAPSIISATIWNRGLVPAENVEVVFKDFDEIIGSAVIPSIVADDSNTVSIEHTWTEAGFRLITVTVDPTNEISESDETNNTAGKLYQVGDIGGMSALIEVSCGMPAVFPEGATANISGEAFYRIEVPNEPDFVYPVRGGSVSTRVFDSNGVQQLLRERFSDTDGRFSVSFPVPGQAGDVFDVNIAVTDATLTGIWEGSFSIGERKDLWINWQDISFSGSEPNITIEAIVNAIPDNTVTVFNVPVTFSVYPPQNGNQIGSTQYITEMPPGANEPASVIWYDAPNGLYCIEVELGPGFSDDNNANNRAIRALAVGPEPNHIEIVIEVPAEVNASDITDVNVLVTDDNGNVMIPCLLDTLMLDFNGVDEGQVDLKPYFDWATSQYIYPWQPPTDANGLACLEITAQSVDILGKVISGANSVCVNVVDNAPPNFSISASPYWARIGQSVRITIDSSEPLLSNELDWITVKDIADQNIPFDPNCEHPTSTRWIYQTDPLPEGTPFGRATIRVEGTDLQGHTGSGQKHFYVVDYVPDFWVHSEDISFSDEEPNLGDTIAIGAVIHASSGNDITGPNIPVTFYARHPAGDYQIGDIQQTGQIPPGGSDSASVLWTNTAEGWYVIEVELGPEFSDRNAKNNRATRALLVGDECFEAEDFDCDGVHNDYDNCPWTYNPAQSNVDGDGAGDLCDICPADELDECDPNGSTAEEIDPNEGGIIETPDGILKIIIEPNDLNDVTTVSITKVTPPDPNVDLMISSNPGWGRAVAVYILEPDGQVFENTVTVTITADVTDLNQNQRERLGVYLRDEPNNVFVLVEGADCNIVEDPPGTFTKICTLELEHFSTYAMVLPMEWDTRTSGDFTGEGEVNGWDLKIMADDWLESGSIADIYPTPPENDDIVNFFDFAICAQNLSCLSCTN